MATTTSQALLRHIYLMLLQLYITLIEYYNFYEDDEYEDTDYEGDEYDEFEDDAFDGDVEYKNIE